MGKNLLLRFEGGVTVRSHLRMNGRWRVGPIGSTGAGRPWLLLRGETIEATQWNGPVLTLDLGPVRRLGPDLLADGSDPAALVARLRRGDGSRPLGEVLQDQRLVAGIGNMWMSEALWAVRLSPWLPLAAGARRGARRGVAVGTVVDARLGCGCAAGASRVPPRRAPVRPLWDADRVPGAGRRQPHRLLVPCVPAGPVGDAGSVSRLGGEGTLGG